MSALKSIDTLRFDGGVLCLDFVNTISNRMKPDPYDYLPGFRELLQWYTRQEIFPSKVLHTLERLAKGYPQKAAVVFEKTIQLRELLLRLFTAVMAHKSPAAGDLQLFNTYLSDAYTNIEMTWRPSQQKGELLFNAPALEQVTWWLVKSAQELFTGTQLQQVRQCPACGWLFLDKSRNGSRRWCNMSSCGDIHKVTKYYQRNKKKQP
ncbi:CGNR zinc finger domain-containing protein [Chitinophaga solisilvae]|uniref:CGNR zinc finger domain-containing protein n=1 Tax=Chitinophaga solisilvae TaxID=1233460 RepID=UPI00136AEC6A|nr:CGNR zinc finger domain-containing protein [Chitinophaga solisilvae]